MKLHSLACSALGYSNYKDDGKFPDIKHQLIEVKLQTSPTIDLGLFLPTNEEAFTHTYSLAINKRNIQSFLISW